MFTPKVGTLVSTQALRPFWLLPMVLLGKKAILDCQFRCDPRNGRINVSHEVALRVRQGWRG